MGESRVQINRKETIHKYIHICIHVSDSKLHNSETMKWCFSLSSDLAFIVIGDLSCRNIVGRIPEMQLFGKFQYQYQ